MNKQNTKQLQPENGTTMSESVLACIAAVAVAEVDGVFLPSWKNGDLKKLLKKGKKPKEIAVSSDDSGLEVTIAVGIRYGTVAALLTEKVREHVTQALEKMTGAPVKRISIDITRIEVITEEN